MSKYEYYKRDSYYKLDDSFKIPSYQDFNYERRKIAPYLIDEDEEEKGFFGIKERIENLKTKRALSKIKDIIINETKNDYYKNMSNISEVVDIDTHLMKGFIAGIDYMHVENLVIWKNGFYNFNRFNFPIPSSVRKKIWECGDCGAIIPKKLSYCYEKHELICK